MRDKFFSRLIDGSDYTLRNKREVLRTANACPDIEPSRHRRTDIKQLGGIAQVGSGKAMLLAFGCFLVAGILLAGTALNAPFFWDDLHLIRVHSSDELSRVWMGTWDTDHIETPGFRPLTAYFNQFRALAFGESVAAHRVFLLALFALYLTLAGMLAHWLFRAGFLQILLGGLLGLLHIRSAYHYLWISDGIHLLGGTLVLGAILALLQGLRTGRSLWLLACLSCASLAVLTREDSLTVYPLLIWFGSAYIWMTGHRLNAQRLPRCTLALFGAGLVITLGLYWYWRGAAVPEARPVTPDLAALPWALAQTLQNAGDFAMLIHPWPRYALIVGAWLVWLGLLVLLVLFRLSRPVQSRLLFWAGALIIAVLPLLSIARANLLLLPVTFWGLLLAEALAQLWQSSHASIWRASIVALVLYALAAPAYGSFIFAHEQRLNNLVSLCANVDLIYGGAARASIPEVRRASWQEQFNSLGIFSADDFNSRWPQLIREARAKSRYGVQEGEVLFIPRFDFIPGFPRQWRCTGYLR